MSDKELDEILDEIKMRANAKTPVDPPQRSNRNENDIFASKPNADEAFSAVPEMPSTDIDLSFIKEETPVEKAVSSFSLSHNTDDENQKESDIIPDNSPEEMFDLTSQDNINEYDELPSYSNDNKKSSKKTIIIAVIAVIVIIAIALGVYFGFFYNKKSEDNSVTPPKTVAQTVETQTGPLNPLTGESNYNADAVGKRPVAVVVENEYSTESVRPQLGISDADIVLEGESEYSTRLLLFWADYTALPEQVAPVRSARPPFIRFSQLFDSVFIHAGLSKSKGNYIGADTVFTNENVDHINLLSYSEDGTYFGRDYSRTSTVEHTGYLNGTNLPALIEEKNFNTDIDLSSFSFLNFNDESKALSETSAESVSFIWSDVYSTGKCPKTGNFTYDKETGKYTTTDFDSNYGTADLQFENLIFLLDETEYVVKENYKGSGNSETYCNYKLSGGEGAVLSQGTYIDITWGVENGKLWMKDAAGNDVALNPGKSYIGYGSSNHGGSIAIDYKSSVNE